MSRASPKAPLYARIESLLRDAIAEGRYAVGALLPTEAELCDTLRVSRHTIREALRRLVEAGLVERRQGAGTVVVSREPARGMVQSLRSIEALFQYAADTRLRITSRRLQALDAGDAAQIPAEAGTKWLHVEGLRIDDAGRPIAATEVFVHPRFAAISLPSQGAIYAAVEARFGVEVTEVVQEITASAMPAPVAAALGRKPRAIGLRFLRRYLLADGSTMLVSRNWHPAELFTYTTKLKRAAER